MDISFIILNYRSEKYLRKCIGSIRDKSAEVEFEIIVVNNDEKKLKTLNWFSDDRQIKILEINENIGFAKANNRGAKLSTGKYICFINPDANIISNNVAEIIREFENNPEVGVIGPKILKNGKVQKWSAGADLDVVEILKSKLGFAKSKKIWESQKKVDVDWVSGVSMFIKRDVFNKIKGFDENFFLYYEDVDLCKRVRGLSKKVIYFPFFEIEHLEGASSRNKYKQKLQYFKSQDYYYKKWFRLSSYCLLKFFRFFYLLKYRVKQDQ